MWRKLLFSVSILYFTNLIAYDYITNTFFPLALLKCHFSGFLTFPYSDKVGIKQIVPPAGLLCYLCSALLTLFKIL